MNLAKALDYQLLEVKHKIFFLRQRTDIGLDQVFKKSQAFFCLFVFCGAAIIVGSENFGSQWFACFRLDQIFSSRNDQSTQKELTLYCCWDKLWWNWQFLQ